MSTNNNGVRYDDDFKRTIVNLYQSGGKTQSVFCKPLLQKVADKNTERCICKIQKVADGVMPLPASAHCSHI